MGNWGFTGTPLPQQKYLTAHGNASSHLQMAKASRIWDGAKNLLVVVGSGGMEKKIETTVD